MKKKKGIEWSMGDAYSFVMILASTAFSISYSYSTNSYWEMVGQVVATIIISVFALIAIHYAIDFIYRLYQLAYEDK